MILLFISKMGICYGICKEDDAINDSDIISTALKTKEETKEETKELKNENLIDIKELEKQLEALKKINEDRKNDIYKLIDSLKDREEKEEEAKLNDVNVMISMSHIERIVDDMLKDENINIKYLPDFVERQLYLNIIRIMLNLTATTVQSSKIGFLGHEISLKFTSKKPNVQE